MKKLFTILFLLVSFMSYSQSTTLVISQVYGAGGNSGAPLNADYVELHNISAVPQSLAGLSIQYASATSTAAWSGVAALPSVSIPPGGYFLIQMSSTGTNGSPLPAVDHPASPTIAMSATSGKVALVQGTTALSACPTANVIDKVGYGTANCSETNPTAVLSVTEAAFRNNNGCTDTDNNQADFTNGTPAPRNSASPVFICGSTPTNPSITAGTLTDFGNVNVGSASASQTFTISGSNLIGAPGNITVTAPNTNFQVSLNGTTWSSSVSVPYTSATLSATQIFVQFTPQSAGPQSGNISITGGGVSTAVTVAVSGNGVVPSAPTLSASGSLAFGNVCINTVGGPNAFSISGSNLTTQDITVGPLSGYTFSTTSGGTYSASLTLTQGGGSYSQNIFVQLTPTAVASYNGNIPVNGGGISTAISIAVTGSGVNTTATVTTGNASAITTNSATLAGSIPSKGCSDLTSYGFEYSLVSGFSTGTVVTSTNLVGTNYSAGLSGLAPATTYYYKSFAVNAGGRVYGNERSFTTAAPPPPVLNATIPDGFGTICINTSAGPNSFDITGSNLTTGNVTVGPLDGYSFSTSATGTFTSTLDLTQTSGSISQTVYALFTPTSAASYNGNVPVSGAGAPVYNVPVVGSGINSTASLLTGDSLIISANIVEARGTILDNGCSDATAYGIEYSGVNGFISGTGTRVLANNLTAGDFSSRLTGLVQNTIYYYKAFAINNGGIAYGSQRSFITPAIPAGLVIYSVPVQRGTTMHYSLSGIKPGHYSARIHNSIGQLVYQRDLIIPVNFIDDEFVFPSTLPMGLYNLEVRNHEFKIQKSFLVN